MRFGRGPLIHRDMSSSKNLLSSVNIAAVWVQRTHVGKAHERYL